MVVCFYLLSKKGILLPSLYFYKSIMQFSEAIQAASEYH